MTNALLLICNLGTVDVILACSVFHGMNTVQCLDEKNTYDDMSIYNGSIYSSDDESIKATGISWISPDEITETTLTE